MGAAKRRSGCRDKRKNRRRRGSKRRRSRKRVRDTGLRRIKRSGITGMEIRGKLAKRLRSGKGRKRAGELDEPHQGSKDGVGGLRIYVQI